MKKRLIHLEGRLIKLYGRLGVYNKNNVYIVNIILEDTMADLSLFERNV